MIDKEYKYLENGIRMEVLKEQTSMPVNIAWLYMKDPDVENIYSWLAADPTLL